ncbi:hypothetical protein F3Y22_tig00110328pilonHSYRG00762 [Hibiscus syriacus]|uniref:Ubiquitin-like protease family profile domain-containing protein n=1 Tax=Hibiscus syriacus TaxID=106335 RepID=A0A6A3B3M1_HIBSY|nr:hypothetical protein F3Y22_tig00110328pilonHSYRG00762 [Hibiscus syriacus]
MGFESLIGVGDRPIRRELCRSLMEQFDVKQCIAKYGDYSFPLGVSTAAAVLGVQNKGKSVVEVCSSTNWKALASKFGLNQKVTYAEVEKDIKSGSYGGDELKAQVLLYLVGIFLCPTGDTSTNKEYMKLICDEGLKGEFNWAEYVYSRLIESIITFQKGSHRYLKGCIAILEVALFDFWSGCDSLPAYERNGVARIHAWGKEEVVRVMAKLKLDRPRKLEMGEVKGNVDVVVNEVEVLRELNLLTGGKIDVVVKEVVELRNEELCRAKYDELKKFEEEEMEEEEKMEEMRRKDVTNIYTPESVIDADLDSECPAPHKKKQKRLFQAELNRSKLCSVISMGNQYASVSNVATLKPSEWVGGVVIDLLTWTVCYDSKKSGRTIGYIPYHLAGPMLHNYEKFTNCEKIMITINHNNSHWYLLVLDMVDRVATVYDSLFISATSKQRVNDAATVYDSLFTYAAATVYGRPCCNCI